MNKTTWSQRLLRAALSLQGKFSPMVPIEIKQAGKGRKGRLFIEGEDGGVFYLRWNGTELVEEDNPEDVRNDFYMHSQTLLDLATGELGISEAIAARLITITGDRSLYDMADIMQLFEKLQDRLVMALKSMGKLEIIK